MVWVHLGWACGHWASNTICTLWSARVGVAGLGFLSAVADPLCEGCSNYKLFHFGLLKLSLFGTIGNSLQQASMMTQWQERNYQNKHMQYSYDLYTRRYNKSQLINGVTWGREINGRSNIKIVAETKLLMIGSLALIFRCSIGIGRGRGTSPWVLERLINFLRANYQIIFISETLNDKERTFPSWIENEKTKNKTFGAEICCPFLLRIVLNTRRGFRASAVAFVDMRRHCWVFAVAVVMESHEKIYTVAHTCSWKRPPQQNFCKFTHVLTLSFSFFNILRVENENRV